MKITVRDVMTNALVTVQPTTGFREMAARLREGGFSALPVVDAEGKLVGLVS